MERVLMEPDAREANLREASRDARRVRLLGRSAAAFAHLRDCAMPAGELVLSFVSSALGLGWYWYWAVHELGRLKLPKWPNPY